MVSRLSRLLQLVLGIAVTATVLWLAYTNGTGVTAVKQQGDIVLRNYDGEGHSVELPYTVPPKRVLVTYPGATELLITLGLEDHIIMTLAPYGMEPPEIAAAYDKIPKLSAPYVPTKEEVVEAHPDLIMGWNHHFLPAALGDIRYWYQRGIETYIVPATVRKGSPTVEGTVYPFIDDVGKIFGVPEKTDAYKNKLMRRVDAVEQAAKARGTTPTVLVLQSYGNSTYTIYGEKYIIHDIVHKAGAKTIVPEGMTGVGPERILGFDPDYIVLVKTRDTADMDAFTKESIDMLKNDEKISHMRAIEEGHIIPVDFGDVNNGNGRVVDALETINEGLSH